MTIVKLQPGSPAVRFLASRIEDDKSARGTAQWKFVGRTATDAEALVYVSSETAERQCARIGLSRASIIGRWVEFSKTSQNFIDINLASGASLPSSPAPAVAPTPTSAASAEPLDVMKKKEIIAKEKALLAYAFGCANRALPLWLADVGLEVDALSADARAQCIATLGGALYHGLAARGMGQ
jgi:hypothetical protein